MKISVITVCRNAAKTIEKTIQAVLAQTYSLIEYIIVDGDSTDETQEIIHQYQSRLAQFISEADGGIYHAMNKGIRLATGEFIYFSNADDYLYDENVIQDLAQFVNEHPDCDLLYGDYQYRMPSGETGIHQPLSPEQMLEEMLSLLGTGYLHQPAILFKSSLFQTVGLFSETYKLASDYDWYLRMFQNPNIKLYYYPRTIVSFAYGGGSNDGQTLFNEVFDIQANSPLCQQSDVLIQRLRKTYLTLNETRGQLHAMNVAFEQAQADLETAKQNERDMQALLRQNTKPLQKVENLKKKLEELQTQLKNKDAEIAAMKTSKFWRLRTKWIGLKQRLNITTKN